jgi:hypothetical protein
MDIIVESLKQSVKALDELPLQHKTPRTTQLQRLTVELIAEMEKEHPETKVIEVLTEQINELKN